MKCRITRDKKGIDRHAYPTYYFHFEREDGKKVSQPAMLPLAQFLRNIHKQVGVLVNDISFGAVGHGFDSWSGQI